MRVGELELVKLRFWSRSLYIVLQNLILLFQVTSHKMDIKESKSINCTFMFVFIVTEIIIGSHLHKFFFLNLF